MNKIIWRFPKMVVLQIINFNRMFHSKPSIYVNVRPRLQKTLKRCFCSFCFPSPVVQAGSMSQPKATDYCGEKTVAARLVSAATFFSRSKQLRYGNVFPPNHTLTFYDEGAGAIGVLLPTASPWELRIEFSIKT